MDCPDAGGHGAHIDKRLLDDYYAECRWDVLARRYGWAAVYWLSTVSYVYPLTKGGDA